MEFHLNATQILKSAESLLDAAPSLLVCLRPAEWTAVRLLLSGEHVRPQRPRQALRGSLLRSGAAILVSLGYTSSPRNLFPRVLTASVGALEEPSSYFTP